MSKNNSLNERVAIAIGFSKRPDGQWLNSWGAPISEIVDFSGNKNVAKMVVVDHFESFSARAKGTRQLFFAQYHEGMTAREICELALSILEER